MADTKKIYQAKFDERREEYMAKFREAYYKAKEARDATPREPIKVKDVLKYYTDKSQDIDAVTICSLWKDGSSTKTTLGVETRDQAERMLEVMNFAQSHIRTREGIE